MFIGERRIEKRWIRSRISGHLIVDRVSRKPQKKSTWRGAALPRTSTAGVFALALVQREHVKAGGSRELPSAVLSPGALLDSAKRETKLWAIPGSRPLFTRLGYICDRTNDAWLTGYVQKRLPSRSWSHPKINLQTNIPNTRPTPTSNHVCRRSWTRDHPTAAAKRMATSESHAFKGHNEHAVSIANPACIDGFNHRFKNQPLVMRIIAARQPRAYTMGWLVTVSTSTVNSKNAKPIKKSWGLSFRAETSRSLHAPLRTFQRI
jgi:hypothetical protein